MNCIHYCQSYGILVLPIRTRKEILEIYSLVNLNPHHGGYGIHKSKRGGWEGKLYSTIFGGLNNTWPLNLIGKTYFAKTLWSFAKKGLYITFANGRMTTLTKFLMGHQKRIKHRLSFYQVGKGKQAYLRGCRRCSSKGSAACKSIVNAPQCPFLHHFYQMSYMFLSTHPNHNSNVFSAQCTIGLLQKNNPQQCHFWKSGSY